MGGHDIIGFLTIVIIGLVTSLFTLPALTDVEAFGLIDQPLADAIESRDSTQCLSLPQKVFYRDQYRGTVIGDRLTLNPQLVCLTRYYEQTYDVSACELTGSRWGNTCYTFIAEVYSDSSYCSDVDDARLQSRCVAKAELDPVHCFDIPFDESDAHKFPIHDSACIGDVVYRTKNVESCLLIDDSDFGDYWERGRNLCVWQAMYGDPPISSGQVFVERWLCEYMVEEPENDEYSNEYEDCLNQTRRASGVPVPPRIE